MNKTISFPSTLEHLDCIDTFVDTIGQELVLPVAKTTRIKILLNEAVSNAMRHGNGFSAEKMVTVHFHSSRVENQVCFTVSDEGGGFQHDAVPDPRVGDRLEAEGGRGVFLLRELSDELNFENNGATLHIKFCI